MKSKLYVRKKKLVLGKFATHRRPTKQNVRIVLKGRDYHNCISTSHFL